MPGIFPPVEIPPEVFVDGGVLMNTPLAPAIHAGGTEIHVVYLDPEISPIPLSEFQTTLDTLQRTFSIALAGIFNRDIEAAERINRSLALALGLERSERRRRRGATRSRSGGVERSNPLRAAVQDAHHPSLPPARSARRSAGSARLRARLRPGC